MHNTHNVNFDNTVTMMSNVKLTKNINNGWNEVFYFEHLGPSGRPRRPAKYLNSPTRANLSHGDFIPPRPPVAPPLTLMFSFPTLHSAAIIMTVVLLVREFPTDFIRAVIVNCCPYWLSNCGAHIPCLPNRSQTSIVGLFFHTDEPIHIDSTVITASDRVRQLGLIIMPVIQTDAVIIRTHQTVGLQPASWHDQ